MVKLLILDCDGVLADGKIVYTEDGLETKSFSAIDGLGIGLLRAVGIKTAVITGRKSLSLARRCVDLKITHLYQGIRNKVEVAEALIKELSIDWENVAFMGDDWNDYQLLNKVAISGAPCQSFPDIKKVVDFIADREGGNGAVREFIEYILKSQGYYETAVEKFIEQLNEPVIES